MRFCLPAITAFTLLFVPAAASAADGENTPLNLADKGGDAPAAAAGGGGGALVRTIIGLVVVIAIIYGIAWVLRQVKASRESSDAGSGLETLATLALGSDRAVHLVRAGDELVLVGSAPQGVTHLRTYTLAEAAGLGLIGESADRAAITVEAKPALPSGPSPRGLVATLREKTVLR